MDTKLENAHFRFILLHTSVINKFVFRMLAYFPSLSPVEFSVSSLTTQIKLVSLFLFYIAIAVTFVLNIIKIFNMNNRNIH